jgi:hypothetical protein
MALSRLKFDVFGRMLLVERTAVGWDAYDLSGDGKRRRADGVLIPSTLAEDEIERWLADLCHESATARNPSVRRL